MTKTKDLDGQTTFHNASRLQGERLLTHTFDTWRNEFRGILEDHRREIQTRLTLIEHEIEKKSDKETVDLLIHSVQEDLHRQAEDIKTLATGLTGKMGVETMWKVIGLVLTGHLHLPARSSHLPA